MNAIVPWLILLAPLGGAGVITLFTLRWKTLSSAISVAAVLVSFVCSCLVFAHAASSAAQITWIDVADELRVRITLTLDPLSRTMVLLVSAGLYAR